MNEKKLFTAALEIADGAERESFLRRECEGQPALKARVVQLLESHSQANTLLDNPTGAAQADVDTDETGAPPSSTRAALQFDPCDSPGRIGKLGGYEIIESVGRGAMGEVLRAWDTKLHREVALKVMSPELAANSLASERFLREARSAASVIHDHVVRVHSIDDAHQPPLLAMEFIEGETLRQRLDREGALPVEEVIRLGQQIAGGLAAAHAKGLIHRDVKPGNILLDRESEIAVITDFGLARASDHAELTQEGMILGTPRYMSPEQARGENIDSRSDLFSLGSVLYAMCTGQPAFPSDTTVGALHRVCHDTPTPIRKLNAKIPKWLESVVNRLLEKAPGDRFQTAEGFAEVLINQRRGIITPRKLRTKIAAVAMLSLLGGVAALGLPGLVPVSGRSDQDAPEIASEETVRQQEPDLEAKTATAAAPASSFVSRRGGATEILTSPDWQWSTPVKLGAEVNHPNCNTEHPTISDDGLTLMFSSQPPNTSLAFKTPYYCRRASVDEPFGPRQKFGKHFNSWAGEDGLSLSPGGLQLVCASSRSSGWRNSWAGTMWLNTRRTVEEPFGPPEQLVFEGQQRGWSCRGPYLTPDGLTLFFHAWGKGLDDRGVDLFMTTRNSITEIFSKPINLGPKVNSAKRDLSPHVTPDGCTLLFASDRGPTGKHDLWMSRRSSPLELFGEPTRLPSPISVDRFDDRAPSLSADGKTLVFHSNRDGWNAIWESRRVPTGQAAATEAIVQYKQVAPAAKPATLTGTVSSSSTPPVVDGADIAQLDIEGAFRLPDEKGSIWDDRPAQGQTFTTGDTPGKFLLDAMTLQAGNADARREFVVRIGKLTDGQFELLATASGRLQQFEEGDYITFRLASPVELQPNTRYGFDWATPVTGGFVTLNCTDSQYAGGSAYSSGEQGKAGERITLHRGESPAGADRVFHLNLTEVALSPAVK